MDGQKGELNSRWVVVKETNKDEHEAHNVPRPWSATKTAIEEEAAVRIRLDRKATQNLPALYHEEGGKSMNR